MEHHLMSSIYDTAFVKTLEATFEAANTANTFYVNTTDGSLVTRDWFSSLWSHGIAVADLSKVIEKLDEAFVLTERMLELHPDQQNDPEINRWILAALRTNQLFLGAKEAPTKNPVINEIAKRHVFHFKLPDNINQCAVGLARVSRDPQSLAKIRGPNVIGGRYFYGKESTFFEGLLHLGTMMFFTQLERLTSLVVRVIQAVAHLFGCSLSHLSQVHYFRNNETDADIYDTTSIPISFDRADATRFSSYWIGHSTCLFSVPVKEDRGQLSRINILTDPVEGDLNSLFYPRMTKEARPIEQCPPIHVCMLSHNHQDHLSPSTLQKLLGFNPLMIVPTGDGEYLRSLGFTRVVELGWLEHADIEIQDQENMTYRIGITGVPANHGSGSWHQPTRKSLFNGYVIHSQALDGDIYFAGDTARLDPDHIAILRDTFDIKYSFQPGGPDEIRSYNLDSHQASCEGIAMHLHLMVKKAYQNLKAHLGSTPSFQQLLDASSNLFTVYMHTKTYKLGNLHFDDTDKSVGRIFNWLKTHETWEGIAEAPDLVPYEKDVLFEIADNEGREIIVSETQAQLTPKQIAELLEVRRNINVPKIGARFSSP